MIIEPNIKELLEQLPQMAHGKALISFLNQIKGELNDISTIKDWEDAVGRRKAVQLIDDLFKFMEEKKPTQGTSKNQYV